MPRGSKPGERRGGRKRGTPNKSTLLKNAAIKAAATDPNLSPLDFLQSIMRQRDLPLELRVKVAQQALPFAHPKPKNGTPVKDKYGRSRTVVNEKTGPRVKVVKVNSDDADADSVTPLDFLLGVMRDADSPVPIRVRVAGIATPYVHPKGEPNQVDEAPGEMIVVEDPYEFDAHIGDTLEFIHQDQERLRALEPVGNWHDFRDYVAALEKVKQTSAYLELKKRIADKQAALKCPPNYKELDSRQDRARLKELDAESETRPLTTAEEVERKHLQGRLHVYSQTKEAADCRQMNLLKAVGSQSLTPKDKLELEKLEALYPGVPLDPTLIEDHVLLAKQAINKARLHSGRE